MELIQLRGGGGLISFEELVLHDSTPIYQQIVQYVKHGMAGGTICDGDELPSRRVLSALLGVNPNTVQKAFRQLEEEGLIQSRTGAKSCAALSAATASRLRSELLREDIRPLVGALKQTGLTKEEALQLLDSMWEGEP